MSKRKEERKKRDQKESANVATATAPKENKKRKNPSHGKDKEAANNNAKKSKKAYTSVEAEERKCFFCKASGQEILLQLSCLETEERYAIKFSLF